VILTVNSAGTRPNHLTTPDDYVAYPRVSRDGRYIYGSFRNGMDGLLHLKRMTITSGELKQITHGNGWDLMPTISPDGKWVVYTNESRLLRIPSEGGNPVALTEREMAAAGPEISPDGKLIAFYSEDVNLQSETVGMKLVIIPLAGGQPTRIFDI